MNKEAVGEKTAAMKAQQRKNFIAKYGSLMSLSSKVCKFF